MTIYSHHIKGKPSRCYFMRNLIGILRTSSGWSLQSDRSASRRASRSPGEGEKANAIRNAGDKVLNIDNVRNGGRRQRGDQEFTAAIER
ncbi:MULTISPECIES: hypothetical protein [Rhizobium]|uniref:hypothetical protein n=2 Tax=Rhizobium TaxID=379 RepID=UPI00103E3E69|nr:MULTISPECIES: hypothetical protein [Rhizobium]MBX5192195.1 hypothetical protein [Rhizobium sp. NZLR3b]MBY5345625.1 hypothetical protein [Rhizobium leguminosarum]MBY5392929.1 hypothetical protein [Rhizobium leguminosarum]MBY5435059.1 hypothetical protein [Rhizobium leguminosarum]MBY5487228.1 hypothetical protein [Rhizobium leguminosarum]